MSSNLEAAALAAALEDGVTPSVYLGPVSIDIQSSEYKAMEKDIEQEIIKMNKKGELRRGKWTVEEEAYANRLIHEFKLGLLPLTDGTTLRTFLSKLLNCDPMRISKKFVGQNCIGKQVFRRRQADLEKLTPAQIQKSRNDLVELERCFLERVALTNKSKSAGEPKNGRYIDENCGILQPWMMPPEESKPNGNSGVTSSNRSVNSVAKVIRLDALHEASTVFRTQHQSVYDRDDNGRHNYSSNSNSMSLQKPLSPYSQIDELDPNAHTTMYMNSDLESSNQLNNSLNRVNSLDTLCSLDLLKMPSPRSVEMFQTLIGRDGSFPWGSSRSNDDSTILSRANSDVPMLPQMLLNDPTKASARSVPTSTSTTGLGSVSPSKRLNSNDQTIVKNSSVENFWMLVNYGDLPRPDTDVLSETLWQRNSANSSGGIALNSFSTSSAGLVNGESNTSLSSLLLQNNYSPAQILHMQQHRLYDYYTKQQEPFQAPHLDASTSIKRKREELVNSVDFEEQNRYKEQYDTSKGNEEE